MDQYDIVIVGGGMAGLSAALYSGWLVKQQIGSGLRYALSVNRLGDFLFCLEIPNCFIIGAEPAYHGRITVEMTSNLNCFHAAPSAG
jgi:alkyl hydroperoxide reductase subunit AhpF